MVSHHRRQSLLAMVAALAGITLTRARSASTPDPLNDLGETWVHGHGAYIGFPDRLESATSDGGATIIRGRSYTNNCLHFALAVPQQTSRVKSIALRFRTHPGATLCALHVFDGERKVASLPSLALQHADWSECRVELPERPSIGRGLGVSVDISFGDVEREFFISAVGAEFTA